MVEPPHLLHSGPIGGIVLYPQIPVAENAIGVLDSSESFAIGGVWIAGMIPHCQQPADPLNGALLGVRRNSQQVVIVDERIILQHFREIQGHRARYVKQKKLSPWFSGCSRNPRYSCAGNSTPKHPVSKMLVSMACANNQVDPYFFIALSYRSRAVSLCAHPERFALVRGGRAPLSALSSGVDSSGPLRRTAYFL